MDNVVVMPGVLVNHPVEPKAPEEFQEQIVRVLNDLLAMALHGELQGLYAIGFKPEGDVVDVMCDGNPNTLEVVGALEAMKFELLSRGYMP